MLVVHIINVLEDLDAGPALAKYRSDACRDRNGIVSLPSRRDDAVLGHRGLQCQGDTQFELNG